MIVYILVPWETSALRRELVPVQHPYALYPTPPGSLLFDSWEVGHSCTEVVRWEQACMWDGCY